MSTAPTPEKIAEWQKLAAELAEWSSDPETLIGRAAAAIPVLLSLASRPAPLKPEGRARSSPTQAAAKSRGV